MAREMTLEEVRTVGLKALLDALGPDGMIRFLQQFGNGRGDYTAERHRWLKDVTLDELIREAREIDPH